MSVWIVIPTLNERQTIERLLPQVQEAVPGATVVVVDDQSQDGTPEWIEAQHNASWRVLRRTGEPGLGYAYREGMAHAVSQGATIVIQMDADGSHPVETLAEMIDLVQRGTGVVIGSRWVPGAVDDRHGLRRWISLGGSAYTHIWIPVPIRDLTSGFKAWQGDVLRQVLEARRWTAAGFAFQIGMTTQAWILGASIKEIPFRFRDRTWGHSKMSGKILMEAIRTVPRLRKLMIEMYGRDRWHNAKLHKVVAE